MIDADYYLEYGEYERVAQDFYNDTYLSDQNACTSPRVIIWYGNNKEKAKEKFWDELETLVEKKVSYAGGSRGGKTCNNMQGGICG